MTMTGEEEIALSLRTAIPINDVDQMLSPGLNFAIIWVDISDRPDLQVLTQQEPLEEGYSICTWFYDNPGRRNMRIGRRIEMRQPVRFVLPLVFQMSRYSDPLTTISQEGNLWIVPGPPPAHLTGSTEMDLTAIMNKIVAYSGQGLFITLQEHMVVELRERLAEWKGLK
jgi:hypothetical protein